MEVMSTRATQRGSACRTRWGGFSGASLRTQTHTPQLRAPSARIEPSKALPCFRLPLASPPWCALPSLRVLLSSHPHFRLPREWISPLERGFRLSTRNTRSPPSHSRPRLLCALRTTIHCCNWWLLISLRDNSTPWHHTSANYASLTPYLPPTLPGAYLAVFALYLCYASHQLLQDWKMATQTTLQPRNSFGMPNLVFSHFLSCASPFPTLSFGICLTLPLFFPCIAYNSSA